MLEKLDEGSLCCTHGPHRQQTTLPHFCQLLYSKVSRETMHDPNNCALNESDQKILPGSFKASVFATVLQSILNYILGYLNYNFMQAY
jgi:hypothetical protein